MTAVNIADSDYHRIDGRFFPIFLAAFGKTEVHGTTTVIVAIIRSNAVFSCLTISVRKIR